MQERIYFDLSNLYQNLYESYETVEEDTDYCVLEYLLDEGYADNVECAGVILERMSDEWYNLIVEEKKAPKTELEKLSALKSVKKDVQGQIQQSIASKKPLDPKLVAKGTQLNTRVKEFETRSRGERAVSQMTNSKPKPSSQEDKEETVKYRQSMRSIIGGRRHSPEKSAELQQAIRSRKPSGAGQVPQSSKMNVAPVTTQTREQRRRSQMADVAAGGRAGGSSQATTYVDRSTGERKPLNVLGGTESNYGGRGRSRVTARYGQGSQGTGERGSTPAGSTVDPSRSRTRGTGRRPQG